MYIFDSLSPEEADLPQFNRSENQCERGENQRDFRHSGPLLFQLEAKPLGRSRISRVRLGPRGVIAQLHVSSPFDPNPCAPWLPIRRGSKACPMASQTRPRLRDLAFHVDIVEPGGLSKKVKSVTNPKKLGMAAR
jgi:hypothetical protein